jgi:alanine racemase
MDLEPRLEADRVDPWLEIDTGHLLWNLAQVRRQAGDRPVMAVVKCNAYGHGTVGVARVLARAGVEDFAVVKVAEAVALRDDGYRGRILNFGAFSSEEADQLVRLGVSQSVFTDSITLLAEAAERVGEPARVHIKVDTGMSRVGVQHETAASFIERVDAMDGVEIEGVFTTLTEEPDFDLVQVDRLEQVCAQAAALGISVGTVHAASSSGVAERPGSYLDMVRPGSAIYGFEQLPGLDLRPTLSMKTRVTLVKHLGPGATIGYHRVHRVEEDMLLATLPVGYADGYSPRAAGTADVLIQGKRCPVIAYVSANHTLVDVTDSDVQAGDEVILFGTQDGASISLAEVAERTGSSPYQLATGLNPLLPRVYVS